MIGGNLPPFFLVSCFTFAGGFLASQPQVRFLCRWPHGKVHSRNETFHCPNRRGRLYLFLLDLLDWDCASPGTIERKKWSLPGKQRGEYLSSRLASINL